ncbi:MAG: YeeE/YedE family protein [Thermoanaerobacter sp.]|nr:YeeE/YedE family protein [Thermoanaerobacter sp.]
MNMQRWLKYQWPFWTSGFLIGLAEILYYIKNKTFITFTTSMAQMSAVAEKKLLKTSIFEKVFVPDINWVLIGVIIGASLVALMEKEFRFWVKYNVKALVLSFVGAFIFSFGTRIGGGCTTHHLLGGIASMNISSWVVAIIMQISSFLGLFIYIKLGLGNYFKPQETKWYARQEYTLGLIDTSKIDEKDEDFYIKIIKLLLYLFTILFFVIIILSGIFDNLPHSLSNIGIFNVIFLLMVGTIAGVGIAKTGFGNVCGILTPNIHLIFQDGPKKEISKRINYLTRVMFMGMFPFISIMISVIMLNIAILIGWIVYKIPLPASSEAQDFLSYGHFLGGFLMGMGSIFMLGCEIRNYARLGMGYLTAFAAIPGFILGYLPYVIFKKPIDDWAFSHHLLTITSLPQIAHNFLGQILISISYLLFLVGLLFIFIIVSKKSIGLYFYDICTEPIEKIFLKNILRGKINVYK